MLKFVNEILKNKSILCLLKFCRNQINFKILDLLGFLTQIGKHELFMVLFSGQKEQLYYLKKFLSQEQNFCLFFLQSKYNYIPF